MDDRQKLLVPFPNLGPADVIVPETARHAFAITMDGGTDAKEE